MSSCDITTWREMSYTTETATGESIGDLLKAEDRWAITRDEGGGGADPARGSGLAGPEDRVEAIGGALSMRSRPGESMTRAEIELENAQAEARKTEWDRRAVQFYSAGLRKDEEWAR
jgi:hypothetical protein